VYFSYFGAVVVSEKGAVTSRERE